MRWMFVLLFAVGLVGCSDHPVDQSQALGDAVLDEVCSCPAVTTTPICTMPDMLTEAEVSCLKRVYDQYESEAAPMIDCSLDAGEELLACTRRADCVGAQLSACFDVYETRLGACPELTPAAAAAFDECIIE